MSLLKALQRGLTCVDVPWLPSAMPESRRLVNEIVLGEESDIYQGQHLSHFELYRLAMDQSGASTVAIDRLLFALRDGADLHEAVRGSHAPDEAKHFVGDTFHILSQSKLHIIAAAFTFGREDLIPEMFKSFVRDLNHNLAGQLETFIWYLERHIEVDGEEHGPMALRMIAELCGDDAAKWAEAEQAAIFALESRLRLWDGIAARIV
jgi:pyrroloquinoline quinone (PQQ) biosynthesis protein C